MTRALLDLGMAVGYGLAAGAGGWWLRETVETRRMRRAVARTLAEVNERERERA